MSVENKLLKVDTNTIDSLVVSDGSQTAKTTAPTWFEKIKLSKFWIKFSHWEYWPFEIVYIPVFVYWIFLIIRARAVFFFSASNPSIENGGMLGESKIKILDLILPKYKPKTIHFPSSTTVEEILTSMSKKGICFPFILKPDIGERGSFVEKIHDETELRDYLKSIRVDFLMQEFITFPIEMGVFYYRFPSEETGKVSSIVLKDMLKVTGDGTSTIQQLILKKPRAKLQYDTLKVSLKHKMEQVPKAGEQIELVSIGNHCRGTAFLNGNHLINEQLHQVFDRISKSINGFYFGRFDLRCKSYEDLYKGENIKIMELNGAGSEPGHIYQPGTSIFTAYRDIFHHLNILLKISRENHRRGIPYMTVREGLKEIKKLRAYNKLKNG
ncbi:hypothetical protein QQ008_21480 [Fulvivirgaceae bacterium BMA10]|uniref:ATP-grasp domain-containing protein n=1 Tax=Splendidivirga corallicola TaxID=3051826 RepID=A0ABT8KT90_9BACT|nr:hypothetical protein [Fulvivirgaceae bacterium BMA10]